MIRIAAIYATFAVGLVLCFAGLFAAVGAAWLFLGFGAAMVCFVGIAGTVTAGISALFMDERDEVQGSDFDQWTAHEGAQVVPFRGRAS
jgi:hypothetical protein